MSILVAAAAHAYSFIIQAQDLVKALAENNVSADLVLVRNEGDLKAAIEERKPKVVLAVGNWVNYPELVGSIKALNVKVYPWIVCDDPKIDKFVQEYNEHGVLVTVSEHCKENLVRSGISSNIIKVIPEAVDPKQWYKESETELKSTLGVLSLPNPSEQEIKFDLTEAREQQVPILYTTGGDPTKKGVQEVMRALASLGEDLPWIYLVKTWPTVDVFEKGIEELKLARELQIWPRIRYIVGQFSQGFMRDLLNLSDIYVAPSRSKGFGLPLVEAALCEKPVVTADMTATREKVENGETGFVVKADLANGEPKADIDDLAKSLEKLIKDEGLRSEMGAKGRQRALDLYSPKVVGEQFLKLISS